MQQSLELKSPFHIKCVIFNLTPANCNFEKNPWAMKYFKIKKLTTAYVCLSD